MAVPGKLRFDVKLAFGVGQLGEGLKNGAFGIFLLFYYNQVLGMPGTLAGLAVGTAVVVDAFTDPLAGSLSDHWRSRLGRRHPFMYASILPLAVSFFFLFNPMVSGDWALFAWLVVFANATRTSISLYYVPHNALGAEMTEDFDERTALVGYRTFFSHLGHLLAVIVGMGVFFSATPEFENGQLNAAAYPPYAATLAVAMAAVILWSAWGTRSVIPHLPTVTERVSFHALAVIRRVFSDIATAMRCGSFRWLFSGILIVFVMVGVDGALNIYIYTYFWELTRTEIILVVAGYPIGVMFGAMFSARIFARWGKRAGIMFGAGSWAFWQILPVALRLLGWFPENADALLLPLLVAIRVIQGASTVQANVALGSMVADTADEHELDTGRRQEGVFFAASSFSQKAASGMGNIVAGFALDLIDWPRGTHIRTAADVPADTLVDLGLVYGPYVAGFAVVSLWCFTHYQLSRERHAEILAELAVRRASSGDPPQAPALHSR